MQNGELRQQEERKTYILGFSIGQFDREELDVLTQKELFERATSAETGVILSDLEDFLDGLNSQHISPDSYWFYQYSPTVGPARKYNVSFGYETPMTGRQIYRVVTDSIEKRDELAMDIVSLHGTSYVKKGVGPGRKDKRVKDISEEDYRKMFCNGK